MERQALDNALGSLWAYRIDRFTLNLADHVIKLDLSVPSVGGRATSTLTFSGVSHCYYIHLDTPNIPTLPRFPPPMEEVKPGDYIELSEIGYVTDHAIRLRFVPRTNKAPSIEWTGNIIGSIWGGYLSVRAWRVEIDGVIYEIGYADGARIDDEC